MNEITQDEWLKKAYELAYFLHGDKEIAREIAAKAMSKLDVAAEAQFKRFYYTPTGRETSRAARSKVSLNDLQLLQRLVYIESEPYEKQKEERVSRKDLLVYFVKHLIRITLKRNSFYVALGLSRILHSYGTNETMEIYNTVIQDPERVHDDYYYRSRKGQLMKEIKSRFGDLLSLSRGARGEERFQSNESTEDELVIIKDCLERFTPWSTRCVLPDSFDPYSETINHLSFDGRDPDAEHRVEVNRIHAAMHPVCYCKIIKALGFEEPIKRLEIPKFNMKDENDIAPSDRNFPPTLSEDEVRAIKEILAAQSTNRRGASNGLLRVLVDGDECARLNPHEAESVEFDLGDDAELVEVRVIEKSGDVLLATHFLSFDEAEENRASIVLEGGQKISFQFNPTKNTEGEITGAHCGVVYEETSFLRRAALSWQRFKFAFSSALDRNSYLKPALAFGLLLLMCAVAALVYLQTRKSKEEIVNKNVPKNEQVVSPSPEEKKKEDVANNNAPEKKETPQEKPINKTEKNPPAPDNDLVAIARIPVRGDTKLDVKRSTTLPDLKISEVKQIFIQVGGEQLSKQMQVEMTKALTASGRFKLSSSKDAADAVLKVSVKRKTQSDKVQVTVSVINPRGRVLWPNRKNVTGWQYTGTAAELPARIVKDFLNEAR